MFTVNGKNVSDNEIVRLYRLVQEKKKKKLRPPMKPILPIPYFYKSERIYSNYGNTKLSLDIILSKIPIAVDRKDVEICVEEGYDQYCSVELYISIKNKINNPNYNKQMVKYNKDIEIYEKKLKKYEESLDK